MINYIQYGIFPHHKLFFIVKGDYIYIKDYYGYKWLKRKVVKGKFKYHYMYPKVFNVPVAGENTTYTELRRRG